MNDVGRFLSLSSEILIVIIIARVLNRQKLLSLEKLFHLDLHMQIATEWFAFH